MKIRGIQIVKGPNMQFYFVTAFVIWCSWDSRTPWPILGWLAICAVFVPLSLFLHRWTERQNRKMAEDFPLDPYIQAKYGNK